jgi:hypothetical protein
MRCHLPHTTYRCATLSGAATAALLALPLAGCPTPCPSEPLTSFTEPPRWVARLNDRPTAPEAPPPAGTGAPIPGTGTVLDPPGVGDYAALAVYGAEGPPLNERWLDSFTTWEGATAPVDAAAWLPRRMTAGRLTLLLSTAGRPVARFDLAGGGVLDELPVWESPPDAGGQLSDLAPLGDGTALASRRRASGARGGDLVLLELDAPGRVARTYELSGLSSGAVWPGRIAPLDAETAAVGLGLPDEPEAGAVALVNVRTGEARRVEVPGLASCGAVAALAPDPALPDARRVAVLCTGDPMAEPSERRGAGLALLSVTGPAARVEATRPSAELFEARPPTDSLVGLAGAWVAVRSLGDPRAGRPDALMVADLSSGAAARLAEEPWTERWGEGLGHGGFAADAMELRWPSVRGGILRWRMEGDGPDAAFTPLPAVPTPDCSSLPVRVVRPLAPVGMP